MRRAEALVLALAVTATGCGGARRAAQSGTTDGKKLAAQIETTCAEGVNCRKDTRTSWHRCSHVSRGFRACTAFGPKGERSRIQQRDGDRWVTFAGPLRGHHGWWRRIVASPDRGTLLAQWSGECEIQSTYLLSPHTAAPRPIFPGNTSTAVGWSEDERARVLLPGAVYGTDAKVRYRAGVYLVDPETLSVRLERLIPGRPGC